MATVNVTTANTFEEWRVKTNEVGTAIGNLTNLTEPLAGATDIISALGDHETRTEALDAIVGTEALWDAAGTYTTLRKAANKNHSDITTLASTAGIDLATNTLVNYDGDETTLIAILDAQYAFDGGKAGATNMTTTAQTLAPAVEEVHGEVTTATTNIGTIGSLDTTASNLVAAVNEVHGETNTNTTAIGNIAATYVAVAGDTMTGQLIVAEADGSEAGINAATALTLGVADGTAITVDNQQRIGIGQGAHATYKVDVNGILNATSLNYDGTDIQTKFDSRYLQSGENFQDAVGAMVTGNTESGGITVTYQDADGTLDFVISDDGHNHVVGNIDSFTENVQDIVGAMVGGNTETGITVTYQDSDGTLDFVTEVTDADFTEDVEDIVGEMVANPNTESGITVTYADNAAGRGKLNFDVNDPTITLSGDVTGSGTITNLGNVTIATTRTGDSVTGGDIADNSINSEHYVDGSIDNAHIADNAINSEHYADGSIDEAHLANDSVARSKLKSEVQLIIYNSAGSAVKTLYGAGA